MVEIEINHHCNRACSYCPNSVAERKEKGEMDRGLFNKLMQQLKDLNYSGIVSYEFYNEPLLAKDLDWYIQTTRDFLPNCKIDFYSNGTLLTHEKFNQLISLGVTRFLITKHEGEKDYIFDSVYSSLGPEHKSMVIFKSYKDLKLTNRGGTVEAGPKGTAHLTPCFIPTFLLVVTVLGNVLPCFEDFHEENIMGNIGITHIKDIWQSEKFNKFRDNLKLGKRHSQSPCDKCNRTQVIFDKNY